MPAAACEDDHVWVSFCLENRGALSLFSPEIEDRFPPDKIPRRRAVIYPLLPGHSQGKTRYSGRCYSKRGRYRVGPVTLRAFCPLGLFSSSQTAPSQATLTVYPALEPLPFDLEAGGSPVPLFGGQALREAGEGDVSLAVRDYRAGDSLRRVHWPTSARRGRLAVVEYERHVVRRVALFLDLSRQSLRGLGRHSTLELSIRLLVALGARLIELGSRVSLWGDDGSPVRIPTGGGRRQLEYLLGVLAEVRPGGQRPLSELLREAAPLLQRGQNVYLVAAEWESDLPALEDALVLLGARGCQLLVVLLDLRTFPRLHDRGEGEPPSLHQACLRLTALGARVYTARSGDSATAALALPYSGSRLIRITREELA